MDKSIKLIYLILIVLTTASCKGQEFETELTVYNMTGKTLDSIIVHSLLDKEITFRKVKPDTIINVKCKDLYSKLPPGERGVFSIAVFDRGYYYWNGTGFIGFPGTRLEKKYSLYVYPNNIVQKKDFKPSQPAEKKKNSEYISGNK